VKKSLWIGLPLLLVVAALGLIAWLAHSTSGAAWLLARVPGLQVEAPEGMLLSGRFAARRLVYTWSGGSIEIRGLSWEAMHFNPGERALHVQALAAEAIVVKTQPGGPPPKAPDSLALPIGLRAERLSVGSLRIDEVDPLTGLQARIDLPRAGRAELLLQAGRWRHLSFAGQARIDTAAPLNTEVSLQVQQSEATELPWTAKLNAHGPLARLDAHAELLAAKQALQAEGQVQPFAPWPLNALQLQAQNLDLAALEPSWPRTALSGKAQLAAPAFDAEATLHLELTNAAAGRWDQQALPVSRIALALAGRPDQPTSLRLTTLDAELPGGARVQGQGRHDADGRWQLDARVQGLRPEALDARATPARLDGPLTLAGSKGGPLSATLDLAGTLQNRPLRLRAKLQGEGTQWQIEDALLASGDATLKASGQVDTAGAARLKAELRQFDPHLLWRGAPGSAWARLPGPTRLNADADLDLRGKTLATLSGSLDARLLPGQFAGLALEGSLKLKRERPADAAAFDIDARLGSNRLQSSGQARPTAVSGTVALKAGALAELSPLLALFGQDAIAGQGEGDGGFQLVRTSKGWQAGGSGKLALASARAMGTTMASVKARWELPLPGADADGPIGLTLDIAGLRDPLVRMDSFKVELQGRRSAHDVKAQVSGRIPRESQDLDLAVQLQASGRWDGQAWAGRVARLDVGPLRPGMPALLAARDIGLRWASDGPRLQADPGRAEVGGAFVRWQALSWTGGEHPEARAELQLEDLAAAPWLARWQPDFGWGGDLRVAGHASLLLNDKLTADLLIERQSGDLRVTDEFGARALGLTDLRLALNVHDGVWHFAEGFAGQDLGSFGGALSLRPAKLWPDASTPMEGVLQANVADLATWGRWVPAGWRLGGHASATLQLGGRLGAPELNGRAEGEGIALRHLLYGVDVTEGRFTLDLKGQHAELTRLEARGGEGWLRASGKAELGAKPNAHIQLTADKLRVLSRVDRRLVASGEAQLDLDTQGLKLEGKLRADEGLFDFSRADAPALADDVTVLRGTRDAAPTAPAAPKAARNSVVNLAVDFGRDFKVHGRGLSTTLRGQLQVTQNNGPLRVTGKLNADGGQYAAYGQKLDIERGDITFNGSIDNPSLDLLAVRPNLDIRVGVRVGGTALAPRVALYSEPEMADTDKLSWLLLGRGPDGLGRTDTALLQRAALALLSGEGEGPTGKALRNLGLDELSLSQTDDDTRATIVRLGKQLSRRWYVGYERSLNATTGSWQLIYRIAQRFTLRAQGGDDNALDVIWQWKWN
jgi:translocation and assembly module TamB